MEALIVVVILAALFSLGASVVAVTAAGEARREARRLSRDRDLLNRSMTYQTGRTLR